MTTNFYKRATMILLIIVMVLGVLIAHFNKENNQKAKPTEQKKVNYKLICN